MNRRLFVEAMALSGLYGLAGAAQSQPAYPGERAITMVVPFAPGGGSDILARLIADRLGEALGQTVIVENKPGANGLIAIQATERAKSDGYTLLLGSSSTHVLAPLLAQDKQLMDRVRSRFSLVRLVADAPLVLAVSGKSEVRILDQLLKLGKSRSLTYGTFGTGSSPHVLGELLAATTGSQLVHVPYKGSAPAITDLLGGSIDSVFLTVAAVSAHVEKREVRPLAVTYPTRLPTLPDVPTFREAGVDGMENAGWFAVFAPGTLPASVADRLGGALDRVLATTEIQARLTQLGMQRVTATENERSAMWDQTISSTRMMLQKVKIN